MEYAKARRTTRRELLRQGSAARCAPGASPARCRDPCRGHPRNTDTRAVSAEERGGRRRPGEPCFRDGAHTSRIQRPANRATTSRRNERDHLAGDGARAMKPVRSRRLRLAVALATCGICASAWSEDFLDDWEVNGSNTLRLEHYRVRGDPNSGPYRFDGGQYFDEFNLNFVRRLYAFATVRGQV